MERCSGVAVEWCGAVKRCSGGAVERCSGVAV